MSDETANVLRFSVAPEPSHLLRARERLRDYLRQYCPDRELVSDVVLCLEEACTNAIRHSGSSDDVLVTLRFEGSTLHGEVKDKGRGFDPSSFDPSAPPSPVQDGGRGLYLIARVMHELEFENHDGPRVRIAMHEVPRGGRDALAAGHDDPCADSPEQRRRALLDEMNEGYYELDWEYRYVYVNDAVTRSSGRSREQLLRRTPFEVFPQVAGSDHEVPPPTSVASATRTGRSRSSRPARSKRPEPRKRFEVGQWTAIEPVSARRRRSLSSRWIAWPKSERGPSRPKRS